MVGNGQSVYLCTTLKAKPGYLNAAYNKAGGNRACFVLQSNFEHVKFFMKTSADTICMCEPLQLYDTKKEAMGQEFERIVETIVYIMMYAINKLPKRQETTTTTTPVAPSTPATTTSNATCPTKSHAPKTAAHEGQETATTTTSSASATTANATALLLKQVHAPRR